eukprot:12935968-Prorocentrum_lima.AAC.1
MRKVTKNLNTKNQIGMVKKRPTMLQRRNGTQGKNKVKWDQEDQEGYDEEDAAYEEDDEGADQEDAEDVD